jgi:hypothetical protein
VSELKQEIKKNGFSLASFGSDLGKFGGNKGTGMDDEVEESFGVCRVDLWS